MFEYDVIVDHMNWHKLQILTEKGLRSGGTFTFS